MGYPNSLRVTMASILKDKNRMHRKILGISLLKCQWGFHCLKTSLSSPHEGLHNRFLCTFKTLRNPPEITTSHVESTVSKIRCLKCYMIYCIRTLVRLCWHPWINLRFESYCWGHVKLILNFFKKRETRSFNRSEKSLDYLQTLS